MKKTKQQPPRLMQNVFVLLLLALFALLSTFLITMGARLYRGAVERSDENNTSRILSAVVRSAVWAEDGGEVLIESFPEHGIRTLAIVERFEDEEEAYIKRLFCRDGALYESYTSEERGFDPEAGEALCELAAFEPGIEGHMLTIRLTGTDGTESTVQVRLRAGGAEP